eukprot:5032337-Amphidinium_carterae.2
MPCNSRCHQNMKDALMQAWLVIDCHAPRGGRAACSADVEVRSKHVLSLLEEAMRCALSQWRPVSSACGAVAM